jgi:ribosome-associated heat shock protein Hsp15
MSADALRVDRWLWCTRFFKSRSLATEAVRAGHVRLNGQRTKPARDVSPGDRLSIQKGDVEFEIAVKAIPVRRGPAVEAARCYEEFDDSVVRREQARRARPLFAQPPTRGKPDKRTRRLLRDRQRSD